MLQALKDYVGPAIAALSAEVKPTALAQLEADKAVSPEYSQLQTDIYARQAPELNRIAREIEDANQRAAAERELAIAEGPGRGLVNIAQQLQRNIDPEFFKNREEVARGISALLGSTDPTKLTGSEREEIARAIGQRGVVNPQSNLDAIERGMTFGRALQQKKDAFADTIAKVSASLPALKTGYTGFEIGTRRALVPNMGENRFIGAQQNTGQQAFNVGTNLMNQIAGFQQQRAAYRPPSIMDQLGQGFGLARQFFG
jgi:hypothetical protein